MIFTIFILLDYSFSETEFIIPPQTTQKNFMVENHCVEITFIPSPYPEDQSSSKIVHVLFSPKEPDIFIRANEVSFVIRQCKFYQQ